MQVRTIVSATGADVVAVRPDQTVLDVLGLFGDHRIGFVVVRDANGALIGSVSERDVCRAMRTLRDRGTSATVAEVMTRNVVTCRAEDALPKVMAIMTIQRTRHVLVMDGDSFAGLVSIGDIVKHRLDEALRDEAALRDYIEGTGYSYHHRA